MPTKPKSPKSKVRKDKPVAGSIVDRARGRRNITVSSETVEAQPSVPFPLGTHFNSIGDTSQYELDLFLQPKSEADFEYWAKVPVWNLDEAIALSFGKNPDQVDWSLIEIYRDLSPTAEAFWNFRRIVLRYQTIGRLSDPTYPKDFIEWALQTKTEIPAALIDAVAKRWQQAVDWRQYCYDQKAYYDDQIGKWKAAHDALNAEQRQMAVVVDSLLKTLEERNSSISQLRECQQVLKIAENQDLALAEKPLNTKERESLLKIVIALAVIAYQYDPTEKRSSVPNEIIDDMANLGISLSVDTLRKYLGMSAEFLPGRDGEERPRNKRKRRAAS